MAKKKDVTNVEWVLFEDVSFYDMFCVCPKDDKDFNSPRRFHFIFKDDAEQFIELIRKSHCAIPNIQIMAKKHGEKRKRINQIEYLAI